MKSTKNIQLIRERLPQICNRSFIETMRKGNTGVGYTFEELWGLDENNDSGADLDGEIEFKATRKNKKCKVTAFTQSPLWKGSLRDVIRAYGTEHKEQENRINWFPSLSPKPNPAGLRLEISDDTVYIVNANNRNVASIHLEVLKHRFKMKLNNALMIYADSKKVNKVEHFHYNEAYLCLDIDTQPIKNLILDGKLVVEPRVYLNTDTDKLRDRGMAFRLDGKYLRELYSSVEKIL
jgi:hypothetical protein